MTQFDEEMKFFEEIKNKYKPVEGCHLVLNLDTYKKGKEIIQRFKFDSEEYFNLVNIEQQMQLCLHRRCHQPAFLIFNFCSIFKTRNSSDSSFNISFLSNEFINV